MMNFPGVISGAPSELAKSRSKAPTALTGMRRVCSDTLSRPTPRPGWLRPRGVHRRGRPGAAAGRDVAPDQRTFSRSEPSRTRASRRRVRPVADGVLHRRPRAGAHRRGRSHQRDGAGCGRIRRRSGGRAGHGFASPGSLARAQISGRSRPPIRPICCSCPTWSASYPKSCSSAPGNPGDRADGGAGVGDAERADPAGRRRGLSGGVGGRLARVIGLIPGQIVTEALVEELRPRMGLRLRILRTTSPRSR